MSHFGGPTRHILGDFTIDGNLDLNGNADVSGNETVGGNLAVNGTTDLNNNLDVTGNVTVTGAVDVTGNVGIDGDLDLHNHDITNVHFYEGRDISNLYTVTKEPSGFPTIAESFFSTNDGLRTFTIAPLIPTYSIFVHGIEYVKTVAESIIWPDVEGLHYFYFDTDGILQTTQIGTVVRDVILGDGALIATIYWNAVANQSLTAGEERHGFMPGSTHLFLHECFGAQWFSGGAFSNIVPDGDGSLDAHSELSVGNTVFYDEDLRYAINDGTPQTLTPIAQIPVYYQDGAAGDWRRANADNFPFIYNGKGGYVGVRVPYNQWTGAVWQLTEVAEGEFVLAHIFATNNFAEPIIAIQGQNTYTSIGAARTGAETEITTLAGTGRLLTQEVTALGTIILQTSAAYTNATKAVIRRTAEGGDYIDFRGNPIIGSGASVGDHGNLAGLSDDDHNSAVNGYILRELNATVTDNAIARWDGTGGRNQQTSLVTIDDNGYLIYDVTVVTPEFYQNSLLAVGTGQLLTVHAQDSLIAGAGSGNIGGELYGRGGRASGSTHVAGNVGGAIQWCGGNATGDATHLATGGGATLRGGDATISADGAIAVTGGTTYLRGGRGLGFNAAATAGVLSGGSITVAGGMAGYDGSTYYRGASAQGGGLTVNGGDAYGQTLLACTGGGATVRGGNANGLGGAASTTIAGDITVNGGDALAGAAGAGSTTIAGHLILRGGTASGAATNTVGNIYLGSTNVAYQASVTTPNFYQVDKITVGVAAAMSMHAQNVSGVFDCTGGDLAVYAGDNMCTGGVEAGGAATFRGGDVVSGTVFTVSGTGGTATLRGGNATNTPLTLPAVGGQVTVQGGSASSLGGAGSTTAGGDLILAGGLAVGGVASNTPGKIYFGSTNVEWQTTVTTPTLWQADMLASGTGAAMTVHAQNSPVAGAPNVGGNLLLIAGNATNGTTNFGGNATFAAGAAAGVGTTSQGGTWLGNGGDVTGAFAFTVAGVGGSATLRAGNVTNVAAKISTGGTTYVYGGDVSGAAAGATPTAGELTMRGGNASGGNVHIAGAVSLTGGAATSTTTFNATGGSTTVSGGAAVCGGGAGSIATGGNLILSSGNATGGITNTLGNIQFLQGATPVITLAGVLVHTFTWDTALTSVTQLQANKTTAGVAAPMVQHSQSVSGAVAATGGAITVNAGDNTCTAGAETGGAAIFRGGDVSGASGGLNTSGAATLRSGVAYTNGAASNSATGGILTVNAGDAIATAVSAAVTLTGAAGTIRGGDATSTGAGTNQTCIGGTLTVRGGNATVGAVSNTGGDLVLAGGTGATTAGKVYFGSTAVTFQSTVVTPMLNQTADSTAGVTGDTFTIGAQIASGTGATTGGSLIVRGGGVTGAGTTITSGAATFQAGDVSGAFTVAGVAGATIVRGGNVTNVAALASTGGKTTIQGGDCSGVAAGATATGGNVLIRGGTATGATTNYQGNIAFHADPAWNSMQNGMFLGNCAQVPLGAPLAGGYLYVDAGKLCYMGISGHITEIGAA